MAKVVCLLLVVALAQLGYGLKCYRCLGEKECPIDKDYKSLPTDECPPASSGKSVACLKEVLYDESDKSEYVIRKCVNFPTEKYECVKQTKYQIKACETCTEDECNGASHAGFSIIATFAAAATFLLSRYMY